MSERSLIDEFRSRWNDGDTPRIEDYLNRYSELDGTGLFQSLLLIDLRNRRRRGEPVSSAEYYGRFPEYRRAIADVFLETLSTMDGSIAVSENHSEVLSGHSDVATRTHGSSIARKLGDYDLQRELGRGGFGVVYEARNRRTGNRVALKLLQTERGFSADRLHRFRREFRALSEINHPNLVGMQSLEVDGDQWFFTMDLIDGEDFLGYVRPEGRLDEGRLRSSLSQLAEGILFLHRQGIVHRDLKPSNVMVDRSGRVQILDFGLVAQLQTNTDLTQTRSGMFAGTPRYAAPEQMFGQRSEASDWYAVGTMLYESLTGHPPFAGDQMEVLQQKQNEDPPSLLPDESTDLAKDLCELANGLLRRDPNERLSSEEVSEILGLVQETRSHGTTAGSSGSTGSIGSTGSTGSVSEGEIDLPAFQEDEEIILLGREKQLSELATIQQEFELEKTPRMIWVKGLSGEGKSSLIEHFFRPLRQSDDWLVLSGRCYDRESVPYKAVDCIINPLVSYLRSSRGSWVQSDLPDDIEYLAHLFPLLQRVDAIGERSKHRINTREPERLRARAFYSFRELIARISSRVRLVIWIDDLQWGDGDSAAAWVELLTGSPVPYLWMLGSYRRDEAESSPFLNRWQDITQLESRRVSDQTIEVHPLSDDQCIELASLRTGVPQDQLQKEAEQLYRDTGGNPYFLEQLIEGYDAESGKFRHVNLDEVIARRLSRLPEPAQQLLKVIAVAGQATSADEICRVAGLAAMDLSTLTHMRSERLVRLIGDQRQLRVDSYHDKVRETVLSSMGDEERRQLHLTYAEMILADERLDSEELWSMLASESFPGEYDRSISPRVLDLAKHLSQAEDKRALAFQYLSAEQAFIAYAGQEALQYYRQVLSSLASDWGKRLSYRLSFGMSQCYRWLRETDPAIEYGRRAVEMSETDLELARGWDLVGHAYQQVGEFDQAIESFDRGLAALGIRRPKTAFGKLWGMAWLSFQLLVVSPKWWRPKDGMTTKKLTCAGEVLWKLVLSSTDRNLLSSVHAGLASSTCYVRTGQPEQQGVGYALAGAIFGYAGLVWAVKRALRRSRRLESGATDPAVEAIRTWATGVAYYCSGRPSEAVMPLMKTAQLMEKQGRYTEQYFSEHILRHVLSYVGTASEELAAGHSVLASATELCNPQGICWGEYDVASALCRAGKFDECLHHLQRSYLSLVGKDYRQAPSVRAATDGYIRLQLSDYRAARARSRVSWRLLHQSRMYIEATLLCLPVAIESIAGPDWRSPLSADDRREAVRAIRRAWMFSPMIPALHAHLPRANGRAYYAMGKKGKAKRCFRRAIRIARKKGMNYQLARCLLDRAAVEERERDANRCKAIELLKQTESVIPRAESWLLGDQYDESVVAPEFDVAAWERQNGPIIPEDLLDAETKAAKT